MTPQFDVGMNVDQVKNTASWMDQQGNLAQKTIDRLMTSLKSVNNSWWGGRAADALGRIVHAEASIDEFHKELRTMNQILLENAGVFEAFDGTR